MSFKWSDGISLFIESSIKPPNHKIVRLVIEQDKRKLFLGFPFTPLPQLD